MAAFFFWIFLSTFSVSSRLAAPSEAVNVPFKVCEESLSWTRPSEETQAKLWTSNRTGMRVEHGKMLREWTHYFFLDSNGSADLDGETMDLSGMWTAKDVLRLCDSSGEESQVAAGKNVGVWVLLNKVDSIQRDGQTYTVTVRPIGQGFQKVVLPRPEGPKKNLTFIFVDPQGHEFDRVIEKGMD
jgi:hypothetical protein